MKKTISIILAIVLVLGLSVLGVTSQNKAYAKNAEMRLEVPDAVKKENEFKVTVVLESDVLLYSVDAYLSYNTELLEFIPDNNYVTGANGVLELKDSYGEETKNATYEITFKALETGVAEVALTDVYLIDYEDLDYITVTPSAKQFEIGVNQSIAEDARLSELVVAPGKFTEDFNPSVLNYEMHVGLDVTTVGVSAIPMNEDSVVGLEMPDTLQLGENMIKVTVTALSGNVNVYTIKVIREEIQESSDEESVDDINVTEEEATESTTETEQSTEEETMDNTSETVTEQSTTEEAVTSEETTEKSTEQSTTEEAVTSESTSEKSTEASTTEETVTSKSISEESTNEES